MNLLAAKESHGRDFCITIRAMKGRPTGRFPLLRRSISLCFERFSSWMNPAAAKSDLQTTQILHQA
jgi:hypothetical protein